jgi:3-oxoacyl-[acyl-carrier-protein] synthase II
VGFGGAFDATALNSLDPSGRAPRRALEAALREAGGGDLDVVIGHGAGTKVGDVSDARAVGEGPALTSVKGATGHLLGAAGVVEAIFSVLAIRDGVAPPTINLHTPDPECDLDYVPNTAREAQVEVALSNAMGLGGHNGCVLLGRA